MLNTNYSLYAFLNLFGVKQKKKKNIKMYQRLLVKANP